MEEDEDSESEGEEATVLECTFSFVFPLSFSLCHIFLGGTG